MVETNTNSMTCVLRCTEVESVLRRLPEYMFYDMTGEKYMYIFNHNVFKKTRYFDNKRPPARIGTMEDVIKLTKLFDDLGYKVIVYEDLEHIDILEKMKNITSQDHVSTSCLCFALLSHGGMGGEIYAADKPYHFKEITSLFDYSHSSLVGKPKIMFVQACRGYKVDSGRRVEFDGDHVSYIIPTHADLLVLYSSVEDYTSFRDERGSFMIQELCDAIRKFHKVWDILHIITLVHRGVAFNRVAYNSTDLIKHNKKQMPETQNSLTKFFKF